MEASMTTSAKTVRIFGWYLLALSAALIVAPNVLLGLFGVPATNEVWIRVAGMLAGIVGYYYLRASAAGFGEFIAWTVPARISVLVFFCAFVALGLAPPILILFGVVDAAGAAWTWLAIRRSSARA
jgi:hypothetical protein